MLWIKMGILVSKLNSYMPLRSLLKNAALCLSGGSVGLQPHELKPIIEGL
jgi:hypothetical protein